MKDVKENIPKERHRKKRKKDMKKDVKRTKKYTKKHPCMSSFLLLFGLTINFVPKW